MAMNLSTYLGVTAVVGVVVALQITMLQGSLLLLLLLAVFNAVLVALFNMQLKNEPSHSTALMFLPPAILSAIFTVGMVVS